MVASLFDASRKIPRILSCFPPELKLLCLQGTHDQTVDFHAPLKLYETPVKLDLLYLCGWSHYVPKHSGADRLIGLVTAWLLKALATKAVSCAASLHAVHALISACAHACAPRAFKRHCLFIHSSCMHAVAECLRKCGGNNIISAVSSLLSFLLNTNKMLHSYPCCKT